MMLSLVVLLFTCYLAQAERYNFDIPECNGPATTRQSPIDIMMNTTVYNTTHGLMINNFNNDEDMAMVNNGHTVQVNMDVSKFKHGPANTTFEGDTYEPIQFHFHWGVDYESGSEHKVNGKVYPAELHIVHKNKKYDLNTALTKGDGLLVLGTFIQLGKHNPGLKKITDHFYYVQNANASFTTPVTVNMEAMIPPTAEQAYMHYDGSLTTPKCNEVVQWIVFRDAVTMDYTQFAEFRALHDNEFGSNKTGYISGYWRNPTPLKGRIVTRNFKWEATKNTHVIESTKLECSEDSTGLKCSFIKFIWKGIYFALYLLSPIAIEG